MTPDEQLRRVRNNTLRTRVPRAIDTVRRNLETIADKRTLSRERPYAGRAVFVVGAGPGLARNAALLAQAPPGHPIVAVNSAMGALARRRIYADVAVSIEPLAEPEHLADGNFRHLIADWQAGQAVWDLADGWSCSAGPNYVDLLQILGVPPTPHGGSAANAAMSIAAKLGAEEIVLLGSDLAHDLDGGHTYADGAPWDGFRPTLEQTADGPSLVWHGAEGREHVRQSMGAAPVPRRLRAIHVPHWSGKGQAVTDVSLEMQRRWLMRQATVCYEQGGPRLTNATEQGASVPGWMHESLAEVLGRLQPRDPPASPLGPPLPRETVERLRARLRAQGEASEWMAERMRQPERMTAQDWGPVAEGLSWVEGMASCHINPLEDEDLTPRQKLQRIYGMWGKAGKWAQGDQA